MWWKYGSWLFKNAHKKTVPDFQTPLLYWTYAKHWTVTLYWKARVFSVSETCQIKEVLVNQAQRIVYDFFLCSFPVRYQILSDLDLLSDEQVSDQQMIRNALTVAKERGVLEALAQKLKKGIEKENEE